MKRLLPFVCLLALTGCYSAQESVLPDDMLVAPYTTIEYVDQADQLHVRHTLVRDGNSYVETADDGTVSQRLRLVSVEQDWYIVESTDGDESTMANYAYLHVDTAKGEAQVFLSGANDAPAFEGSYACGTDVCFDDLKDYSAYAEEQIRQGIPPDSTYYVTLTE